MTWTLQCDTNGDGTFNESVTDLLPISNSVRLIDIFAVGHFVGKKTDFITSGSVDVLFRNKHRNKVLEMIVFTTYQTFLKLCEWLFLTAKEYTYDDPSWVVRLLDADGNIVSIDQNRFSFCLIKGIVPVIKAGDPDRIVCSLELTTVGYK